MSRIVPTIKNGNNHVLFSETVCIDPTKGLSILIPTTDEQGKLLEPLHLEFVFPDDPHSSPNIDLNTEGRSAKIVLKNFCVQGSGALTKPLVLTFGGNKISVFFMGQSITATNDPGARILNFTVTVYSGENK